MFISTPLLQKEDADRDQWNDNAKAEKFEAAAAAASAATAEPISPNSTSPKRPMRAVGTEAPIKSPVGLPTSPSPRSNPTNLRRLHKPAVLAQNRATQSSHLKLFLVPTSLLASLSAAQAPYPEAEEMIAMPNPAFARRHERQDSTMTSATVEIGLRLSHAMPDSTEDSPGRRAQGTQDLRNASIVSAFIDAPGGRRRSSSYPVTTRTRSRFLEPSNFVRTAGPPRTSSKAAAAAPAVLDRQKSQQQQKPRQPVPNNMKVLPPIPPPHTDRDMLPSALRSHPMTLPSSPSPRKKPDDWI